MVSRLWIDAGDLACVVIHHTEVISTIQLLSSRGILMLNGDTKSCSKLQTEIQWSVQQGEKKKNQKALNACPWLISTMYFKHFKGYLWGSQTTVITDYCRKDCFYGHYHKDKDLRNFSTGWRRKCHLFILAVFQHQTLDHRVPCQDPCGCRVWAGMFY